MPICPERVLPGRILTELVDNDRCVGGMSPACAARARSFYEHFVRGTCIETSARKAEMVKLTENAFRDLNIAFANELSMICEELDVDVWDLIALANRHPRVQILKPGRHHTTIMRELGRNSLKSGYKPGMADHMAWARRKRSSKLERLKPLQRHVVDRLAMGWSPEQIAGRLRRDKTEHSISHESIYRFIFSKAGRSLKLHRYLAHRKAQRGLRYFKAQSHAIPSRISIANRPEAVENRQEFGHWEGDLIQFRTQRGALLNLTERTTRFCLLSSLESKQAEPTGKMIANELKSLPQTARRSITFDRGGEFADHQTIKQKTGSDIWFCDPHSPWQRGTVENMNGVIRRDMPRKSHIGDYTRQDIEMLQMLSNSTPRKCLNFKMPMEAFVENINGALQM